MQTGLLDLVPQLQLLDSLHGVKYRDHPRLDGEVDLFQEFLGVALAALAGRGGNHDIDDLGTASAVPVEAPQAAQVVPKAVARPSTENAPHDPRTVTQVRAHIEEESF